MSVEIIQQRLLSYQCKTELEEQNALKEITQEVALMALSRANFFKEAEFHGGTELRILHGLTRFSEDLDFALLKPDPNFQLQNYLTTLSNEFETYGYEINIADRSKLTQTVQKNFIKVDSLGKLLNLEYPMNRSHKKIKIKLEIDTNPPAGAKTKVEFLTFPLPFSLLSKDLPSSFAGKIHALLCRKYDKGRDWYDFIWYVTQKTDINYKLLQNALYQQGPWQEMELNINKKWVLNNLKSKINIINWKEITKDVENLLRMNEIPSLSVWGVDFFLSLLNNMEHYLPD